MDVLRRKWRSFRGLDQTTRKLFLQAYVLSALVKFTLIFLPFRKVLQWKGEAGKECPDHPDDASLDFRRSLKSAIRLCDMYTPWKTECYTRALTGKLILNRHGLPGTVYIGFRKDAEGKYRGHAWLRSYDRYITGEEEMHAFSTHSCYT